MKARAGDFQKKTLLVTSGSSRGERRQDRRASALA